MAGIYVHIPFCKTRCNYCDFHSCTDLRAKSDILRAITHEIEARQGFLGGKCIETIYIGGGTPSLCSIQQIEELLRGCKQLWTAGNHTKERADDGSRWSDTLEITLEANPDDLSPEYLVALRQAGINRLSIGVQSFLDRDLRWMNRRHTAHQAQQTIRAAQQAGFDNLTIDLIYGIPAMTLTEWDENLSRAIDTGVEHLSAYHLTIEERTPFGKMAARGALSPVDENLSRAEFERLQERLCGAGYEAYEVSNFAKAGRRARHNSNYWLGIPYLGVGPSAHSFDGTQRTENIADNAQYLLLEPQGKHYRQELLDEQTRFNEFLMTRLRTSDGLDIEELERRFGARKLHHFRTNAARRAENGTLLCVENRYFIPAEHFFISDGIISDLFLV